MTTYVRTDQQPNYPPPPPPQSMDEPVFKLYYFDIRARGEVIRLIFHAAGEPFEDIAISAAQWAPLKPATPFQTLPVLEFEGHQIAQSMSIARFLASEFGLRGGDLYQQALVDSVAETADDLLSDYLKTIITDHPHKKQHQQKERFVGETLPIFLQNLDRFQRKYSREYGYIVGDTLTYGDLAVYSVLDQLVTSGTVDATFLKQFKYATELRKRILSHTGISRYLNQRPKPTLPF